MAITETALTVLGTATPWVFASGSSNPGPLNTYVPFGSGYNDGSASAGGVVSNSSFKFGHNHTHAGETGPTQLAVLAGQMVSLLYVSGTVATQGGGAGNSGPAGTPVVNGASTPLAPGESDTYSLPTNVIPGASGINASCVVNTVTTAVTYVSGDLFDKKWTGSKLWIGNTGYVIASVASPISLTLATSAGTQNGVNAFVWGAQTSIGGIVGAFTDSSGNIVSTFDWASFKGITPPAAFVLTSVAAHFPEDGRGPPVRAGMENRIQGYGLRSHEWRHQDDSHGTRHQGRKNEASLHVRLRKGTRIERPVKPCSTMSKDV